MPAARVITSRWPFVTGSYEPGQIAVIIGASYTVIRAAPYLRLVRCGSGSSGSTRASVSTTTTPSSASTAGR